MLQEGPADTSEASSGIRAERRKSKNAYYICKIVYKKAANFIFMDICSLSCDILTVEEK